MSGSGFPAWTSAGRAFEAVDLAFAWGPGITDTGLGESFAQQLGGEFNLTDAELVLGRIRFEYRGGILYMGLRQVESSATLRPIPEPTAALGFALGLAVVGSTIRRRRG
ncbi:MAG: PEP-CTERM sorting domain-containing protein [Deltaproteobacteria bacterium]|nr:PEP-CTERM sorting domain-containing protein [Deltaproteobacteria bacterium]